MELHRVLKSVVQIAAPPKYIEAHEAQQSHGDMENYELNRVHPV